MIIKKKDGVYFYISSGEGESLEELLYKDSFLKLFSLYKGKQLIGYRLALLRRGLLSLSSTYVMAEFSNGRGKDALLYENINTKIALSKNVVNGKLHYTLGKFGDEL